MTFPYKGNCHKFCIILFGSHFLVPCNHPHVFKAQLIPNRFEINHTKPERNRLQSGNPIFFDSLQSPLYIGMAVGFFLPHIHPLSIVVPTNKDYYFLFFLLFHFPMYCDSVAQRTCAKSTNNGDAGVASSFSILIYQGNRCLEFIKSARVLSL